MSFPVPLPSTFMPLPLAIMIPFMGIQSGVMAQQFGMNFQYGKRKISSMSNEEFNKLTPAQLQVNMNEQIKLLIPTFGEALKEMRPFQRMIFEEMLAVFKTAVDVGLDVARAGVDPLAHIFGQHIHSPDPNADPGRFQPPTKPKIPIVPPTTGGTGTIPTPTPPTIVVPSSPFKLPSTGERFVIPNLVNSTSQPKSLIEWKGILKRARDSFNAGNTNKDNINNIFKISVFLHKKFGIWY